MQDTARRFNRREGAGVYLAQNRRAEAVRQQALAAIPDGNLGAHAVLVARSAAFDKR
jgi:hypothetical protein